MSQPPKRRSSSSGFPIWAVALFVGAGIILIVVAALGSDPPPPMEVHPPYGHTEEADAGTDSTPAEGNDP